MNVLDPGHSYEVDNYDTTQTTQPITFMKREGPNYPGNVGHYPGTNCQELIRVLIHRVQYLQAQIPCWHNLLVIKALRLCLNLFELRAAERHDRIYKDIDAVELEPTCKTCGHIRCGNCVNIV